MTSATSSGSAARPIAVWAASSGRKPAARVFRRNAGGCHAVDKDVAWFAEHHFTNHSICPSSMLMVAHCAAETNQIRLAPAVLALPFYDPLRLVQEAAFTDLLTHGRLVLGLGCGYQPHEFERFRVLPEERHSIMLEAWTILEQGLRAGIVEFSGRHFSIPRTELSMRPFGLAMPDVFVATSHPDPIARMVRGNHTPFMSFGHRGLSAARSFRDRIATSWSAAGGNPDTMPLAVQRYVYVTEDRDDARHAAQCVRDLARAAVPLSTADPTRDGPFLRLMPLNDEPRSTIFSIMPSSDQQAIVRKNSPGKSRPSSRHTSLASWVLSASGGGKRSPPSSVSAARSFPSWRASWSCATRR
ncbi:LLM class flavin-dependent oxidoreductase [Rhizobium sp. RCC_161_2]|uniref:LLM class flavin-dependent oxidoreductase n=1 Tax=Rhizobium sp. RCC_161_2 TaxID=3239219 RepID=UPI00352473C4